ncbi:MAG: hypothetical protein QXM68_03460 [Candidatus Aenigmatarchaeota archaeon]|nr:hypothetical protein [Candidatus Aenigmarchaeota archaeon]
MRLILLLLLITCAAALDIVMTVSELTDAQLIGVKNNYSNGLVNTSFEIFNSGSLGSKSRVRLDVYYQQKQMARLWSHEFSFQPNDREFIEFYWPTMNKTGKFVLVPFYYTQTEIIKLENITFRVNNSSQNTENIKMVSSKFYKDRISVYIKTNSTSDAVIIPLKYPGSWIVEQKKARLYQNTLNYVEIKTSPGSWNPGTITFMVMDNNGNYGINEFTIKRENALNEAMFYLIKFFEEQISKIL